MGLNLSETSLLSGVLESVPPGEEPIELVPALPGDLARQATLELFNASALRVLGLAIGTADLARGSAGSDRFGRSLDLGSRRRQSSPP
jgi:hypothetical protein